MNELVIEQAFENLKETKKQLFTASSNVILHKINFEREKSAAIAKGIEGSNKEIREANLKAMFEEEADILQELEDKERTLKHLYELAEIEIKRIRYVMWFNMWFNDQQLKAAPLEEQPKELYKSQKNRKIDFP